MKSSALWLLSATLAAAVPHGHYVQRAWIPEDEFGQHPPRSMPSPHPKLAPIPASSGSSGSNAGSSQPSAGSSKPICPTGSKPRMLPGAKLSYCCTTANPCGTPQAAGAKATYYGMAGKKGACGQNFPDSAHYIAMNSAIMGSLSSGTTKNPLCGKTITVKNTRTGKTATGFVADKCPGCKTSYGIDLSPRLFTQLASKSEGVFSVEWWFN